MSTDPDELFEQAERLCLEAVADPTQLTAYRAALAAVKPLENNGWRKQTGMTQNQIIMKHLRKAGSLTVREAMVEYSIQSLTKRIQELREDGEDIISTVRYHPVTNQKYVRYSLRVAPAA